MASDNENQMEVDDKNENPDQTVECVLIDSDEQQSDQAENSNSNEYKSMPSTPNVDKKTNLSLNKSNFKSAEKLDKNLKLQIKLETAKKRQEEKERKEREKREKEEQRLKREEEQRKKKEEEERIKLEKQKEREKEKERKAAEAAEKERLRQEAINAKNEEKKKRDEEKRQKEEEKKKLEEEKLKEEEEKRRKEEKIKSQFISFFIKKETPSTNEKQEELKNLRFMPFQPKENMTVAPIFRRTDIQNMSQEERQQFYDDTFKAIFDTEKEKQIPNYLEEIRKNPKLIRKQTDRFRRNQLKVDDESSCEIKEIVVTNTNQTKFKVKYLHFDPKVYKRPPYYGTWRKKSKFVNPRRPFAKDEKIFDYEINSDDEWEDEPEGESIADSDKGEEDDDVVDEDDDDGFFVPHGHLSDDELDEDERTLDPETKKAREAAKKEQWETERKKSSKALIPKCFIVANYWNSENTLELDSKVLEEIKLFERLKIVPLVTSLPINILNDSTNQTKTDEIATTKQSKACKNQSQTGEASPSTAKTIKSNKSKIQLNPQSPMSFNPTASTTAANTASPSNSTTPILKFISKMSKKDVICKLEPLNGASSSTASTSSNNPVPLSPLPSKVTANFATPTTPISPKMTQTSTTAEKRVCSGNGENAVKRLKLDNSQPSPSEKVPTTPNSIINMFKNSGSCKKSLKMNKIENNLSTNDTEPTSPVKMDVCSSDKPTNEFNNKENTGVPNVITID